MSCAVVLYDVNSDSRRALCASIHEGELPSGERKTATVRGDWERVGDEKWQGENRNCGSQTWAPTLSSPHTFPIICLGMSRPSLSLSLSCISAAQSDATVPSKSAIATSRACSVSHTDTGVYTTYEGSGGDCQGEGERGWAGVTSGISDCLFFTWNIPQISHLYMSISLLLTLAVYRETFERHEVAAHFTKKFVPKGLSC